MTPEQFQTILANQGILGELYREQKYQRHLAKNRAEKKEDKNKDDLMTHLLLSSTIITLYSIYSIL